ncbi:hypothetical protein [Lachnoclostridium phytofermentans]|uniref:Uncharacterized protein n=1 Tax=Lachnoclostridium phytofermentans (strain ATCC 700394 / DSM 18823 / ISDg) TaxID=357809 RepID=A9KJ04_LACP7|nr:hypothetical protein [Lachnoclostridium phytofermentans]ABX41003.1 hypothetical protein Cphy_0616 [Lachnoclostridium phytofermentans ISDg]
MKKKIKNSKKRKNKIKNTKNVIKNKIQKMEDKLIDNNSYTDLEDRKVSKLKRLIVIDWEKLSYFVGTSTAILGVIFLIINKIHILLYQHNCEKVYKIPGKYFYNNDGNNKSDIIILFFCLIIFFSPLLIKKYLLKRGGFNKRFNNIIIAGLIIFTGYVLGLINTLNLVTVFELIDNKFQIPEYVTTWINNNSYFIVIAMIIITLLSILIISNNQEVNSIKHIKIRKLINGVGLISYIITVTLFISAATINLTTKEDKKYYETIIIEGKNMVVLSTINDVFLVVEYAQNNGETMFFTYNYMLIDNNNIIITNKVFDPPPMIITTIP